MGGFLSHEGGGGVREGLTFVTKKVVFLNEGFPKNDFISMDHALIVGVETKKRVLVAEAAFK